MARPRLYDPPHVQLRALLLQAKACGLQFEEAWELAMRPGMSIVMTTSSHAPGTAIRWPTDKSDRVAWQTSLSETMEGWRSSYEGWTPTAAEEAVAHLSASLSVMSGAIPPGARVASAA